MSAEDVVLDTMMQTVSKVTAKFLLGCLKEEWMTGEAEKNECKHGAWRFVHDEPGVITRCDLCGKADV